MCAYLSIALGYAYCEDMAQLPNSNSRQKVRAGSNCMCAYRIMSLGTHTARTWRNFQTQGKKFSRVRETRREPNLTGSDGNLRNATLEQISNDMGRCTHETHLLCGRESNAPRRSSVAGAGACAACAGAAAAVVTAPRMELVLDDFSISGFTTWIWKGQ